MRNKIKTFILNNYVRIFLYGTAILSILQILRIESESYIAEYRSSLLVPYALVLSCACIGIAIYEKRD